MEQEQIIVPEYLSSSPVWCRVHVAQCLVFCVVFRRSLFAPLSCIGHYIICVCSFVLYWPLYYLCLFLCPVLAITLFVFVPLSCIGHYIICVCSFVLYWALYYLCLFLCPVLAIILFVFVPLSCIGHYIICVCSSKIIEFQLQTYLLVAQALVARTTTLFLTFCLQIYFQ